MMQRATRSVPYSLTALCLFGLSVANAGAAPPAKGETVITIEGHAAGTNGNAMEQAKQDALRKAVEQACGTFISSQTKVENYAAIYDKAMSFAAGYITEFTVLERRTDNGMSHCKVRATVSKAGFEKEWARLRHTIEAEGNPRCVVIMVEDNDVYDEIGVTRERVRQMEQEALRKLCTTMSREFGEENVKNP